MDLEPCISFEIVSVSNIGELSMSCWKLERAMPTKVSALHSPFVPRVCVLHQVNKNNIKISFYAFFASIPVQFFLTFNFWMGISVTNLYFNAHVIWYAGSRNIGKLGKQLFPFQTNKTCAELQWNIRFTCLKDSSNIVFLGTKKQVVNIHHHSSHITIFTKVAIFN